jgi:ankyrin repeat protein
MQGPMSMLQTTVASKYHINRGIQLSNSLRTPLHVCLRVGKSYECARRLLRHGADVLRENKDSRTPLHTFFNDAICQFIRYHKDDLDAFSQDRRGMTVAHWASWTSQSLPEDITYQSIALEKSVSPYLVLDVHGKSVLHFAAERGNVSLVQHLLRLPEASRIAAPDNEGRTLLHYATASSRFHLVSPLVLTHQSDIYARDQHGQTVLHYAAMRGNASAVEHMLNLGLVSENDLEAKDIDGRTPLRLAQLNGRISVLELLQRHFPRNTATYVRRTMTYGNFEQKVFKNVEVIPEAEVCEEETGRVGKQRANLHLLMTVVLLVLVVSWIYGKRKYSEYVSSNLILL